MMGRSQAGLLRAFKALAKRAPGVSGLVRQRDELRRERDELWQERNELRRELESLQVHEGCQKSFALWGEDRILDWVFLNRPSGFFVDVGAYHPTVHSNTKLLSDRGWTGISVDCNPAMIAHHRKVRPRDVSLNLAVGMTEGPIGVYFFNDWATSNTVAPAWAAATTRAQGIAVTSEIRVESWPLRKVLERHLPTGTEVDLLNVDVETLDLEVLQSNDWARFRPLVVAIEDMEFDPAEPASSPTFRFLRDLGYRLFSRTIFTNFFADEARRAELNGCP